MAVKGFKWSAALYVAYTAFALAAAPDHSIPEAVDLGRDASDAERSCRPLLLEVAAEHCPYCRRLEREYLGPMRLNADVLRRVEIRRLLLDGQGRLSDFDGRPIEVDNLAARYSVMVTPTLLFLDAHGNELVERLVGFSTPELYGGYLDAAIETAGRRLREQHSCGDGSETT